MYVVVCVCTCYVLVPMNMCGSQQRSASVLLYQSYLLDKGPLTEAGRRLAVSKPQRSSCFHPSQ